MFYIADLHIHSHYSIATSKNLNLESLYQWARIKGINVIGTGDFTHPGWFKELQEKLEPDGNGFFRLKSPPHESGLSGAKVHDTKVRFCLSSEISSIYKDYGRVRKNHNLIYARDFETVSKIIARLSTIGNLNADGRPILGLPSHDLLEIVLECSDTAHLIPAHVWTPWFSTLGSKSGYDSIDQCYKDLTNHIFALETGLSTDPDMNWKLSALDKYTLVSNSDAHSAKNLGREANLFNTEFSYEGLFKALKTQIGFLGTYEFFPQEGKYHLDGHRKCNVVLTPQETIKCKGICPICGKPLTIGVLNRIESLADRSIAQKPKGHSDFKYIIPLPEIIAQLKGKGPASKTVLESYQKTISTFGNEFTLLWKTPIEDITKHGNDLLSEAIRRMRLREVDPQPGYDGIYGKIKIFKEGELEKLCGQLYLFGNPCSETKTADKNPKIQPIKKEQKAPEKNGNKSKIFLNTEQQQVRDVLSGAILVKAGPGTGKTSTLIQWIGKQIESKKAKPSEIIAITFTNKSAGEIRERLTLMTDIEITGIRTGTFHSIAYKMLQEENPELTTVYDEASRLSVLRILFPTLKGKECKQLSDDLSELFEKGEDSEIESLQKKADTYREYVKYRGAIDLSDLIGSLVGLWEKNPAILEKQRSFVKSISVDEFQDINIIQYKFISLLGKGKNILAIGDPDQAIYGFRGSDVHLFFRFKEDFHPLEISLTKNYRSANQILDAAGELIDHNNLNSQIQLQAIRKKDSPIKLFQGKDTKDESHFITQEIEKKVGGFNLLSSGTAYDEENYSFSDIAVLYRTHMVGRELLFNLKKANIPVIPGDGTAFFSTEPFIKIANAIRLILHPDDLIALEGILNHLPDWTPDNIRSFLSYISQEEKSWTDQSLSLFNLPQKAKESLSQWISSYKKIISLYQQKTENIAKTIFNEFLPDKQLDEEQILKKKILILRAEEYKNNIEKFLNDNSLIRYTDTGRNKGQGVRLLTFHAVKGLEFPVVFIAGAEEGITPSLRKDSDPEEERRLFYVAMTRAKDELYITHSAKRYKFGKTELSKPSRYLSEFSSSLTVKANETKKGKKDEKDGEQLALF